MARKSELEQRIVALEAENDALRYLTTESPREAIWLQLKSVYPNANPSMVSEVAWAARKVVSEGKIPRGDMVEFLLGPDEEEA